MAAADQVANWFQKLVRNSDLLDFENDLYYLRPLGLSLNLKLDGAWLRCLDCGRIHPESLADVCPACLPARMHPAALEGQIVHAALDLLSRSLGRCGRPPIGSPIFQKALQACDFWVFFARKIKTWNHRLAEHPKAGPYFLLRVNPRELANRTIRLFRECYCAANTTSNIPAPSMQSVDVLSPASMMPPLDLLISKRVLSEFKLQHPSLPFMGVLDLVSMDDTSRISIVDFKTGKIQPVQRTQLRFYAVLWWRCTGVAPSRIAIQSLEDKWETDISEPDLISAEREMAANIENAIKKLSIRPAIVFPGKECSNCPVRAKCDEGWGFYQRIGKIAESGIADMELTVKTTPVPNGFLGLEGGDREISVVYKESVGKSFPMLVKDQRVRLVDAIMQNSCKEVEIRPWTEIYWLG